MMQNQRSERKPRGRYARLICRACRSRKIKCNLSNIDELGPLGSPQTLEKSCERCRSLNLECIVERTTLGRPAAKRHRNERSRGRRTSPSQSSPDSRENEISASFAPLEIKDHLPSESIDDLEITGNSQIPGEQRLFQSTIEFQYFFASVLARDQIFGSAIPKSISGWSTPLPELVSHDMAMAFDKQYVRHLFSATVKR